jgi:hypothetical protein
MGKTTREEGARGETDSSGDGVDDVGVCCDAAFGWIADVDVEDLVR